METQEFKINNIEKYLDGKNEYVYVEFEQQFHYSFKDSGNVDTQKYFGQSFPVYFRIDDNIHTENISYNIRKEGVEPNISSVVFVNDNNILVEMFSSEKYRSTYRIYLNLDREPNVKKKILSENYKKALFVTEHSAYIIIDLLYTPNIRAVKINKILKNIKQKNIDYDI